MKAEKAVSGNAFVLKSSIEKSFKFPQLFSSMVNKALVYESGGGRPAVIVIVWRKRVA